ncbi:hypothetical protein [Desulfoluna spongiiphila]|uniref:SCP-2 sterol transfer family protein n=1 Tax=Desulfoluna spongiiphila TaxID=419481 RepID=A0A1G5ATT4_9BACT|nr:hypothetical protein [Desulfoluna spongiiphila]SCX81266.1 hypothetical protein SAMN05216233_101446 [Desulfoluna spongiiphila]
MNFFKRRLIEHRVKGAVGLINSRAMDLFLETLLSLMRFAFILDRDFRRNIEGFQGRYAFTSRDGRIAASALFDGSRMKVKNRAVDEADVTIVFKDGKALRRFLFSENPDIIKAILDNEISYTGNLNYLAKFAYMAKHLQLNFAS